ncbi:MAG: hypothetical protein P8N51_09930 [Pseudomonadales bacterium]|nr:hypothetical protein [Pseudomonadales bacterium]
MASLLFYNKPIVLNKVEHADTRIKSSGDDYSFAAKTNSVILAGVEFAVAANEYPLYSPKQVDKWCLSHF